MLFFNSYILTFTFNHQFLPKVLFVNSLSLSACHILSGRWRPYTSTILCPLLFSGSSVLLLAIILSHQSILSSICSGFQDTQHICNRFGNIILLISREQWPFKFVLYFYSLGGNLSYFLPYLKSESSKRCSVTIEPSFPFMFTLWSAEVQICPFLFS